MATIVANVDRNEGNYEDVFLYTLNISFNGITNDINTSSVRFFLPEYLELYLGDIEYPISEVLRTEIEGGENISLIFEEIKDLGVSVRIGFGLGFKTSVSSGTQFTFEPELYINDVLELKEFSDIITLVASARFEVSRTVVLPTIDSAPGGSVYYKTIVKNYGDIGVTVSDLEVECQGADLLLLDETFAISITDTSKDGFVDQDEYTIDTRFENNSVFVTLSSFKGESFEFIYKAIVDETATIGSEIRTEAYLSVLDTEIHDDNHDLELTDPVYDAEISVYGPTYSLPGEYISYELSVENTGNQMLTNTVLIEDLPSEIDYKYFYSGTFKITAINQDLDVEYMVDYTTVGGLSGEIGPLNTAINSKVELSEYISEDDTLDTLSWDLETLGVGVKDVIAPEVVGIVKTDTATASSLLNSYTISYDNDTGTGGDVQNQSTTIENICVLTPYFDLDIGSDPVNPGTTFNYTIGATTRLSRLENPVIATLISNKFTYVGNETYNYYDHYEEIEIKSPSVEIIENFNDDGDTLVKFEFSGDYAFDFNQKSEIYISFDVKLNTDATGSVTTFSVLNTVGVSSTVQTGYNVYKDYIGIAEDASINYAKSSEISNIILFFVSISSNKLVKGVTDDDYTQYPDTATTLAGGSVEYKLYVKNIGNANLNTIEFIDILPHAQDTGVIEVDTDRQSEFSVYCTSEITAKIVDEEITKDFEIYYSISSDPVRFGDRFDTIGTDDNWTLEAPSDLSQVKAFKVITTNLQPNQTIEITAICVIPVGVDVDSIAWNSFACESSYTTLAGESAKLLAVEPEKAGVVVYSNDPNLGTISGYAFLDKNVDGIPDDDEEGINDVIAILIDDTQTVVDYTYSSYDVDGNPGYYQFNNIEIGEYYVKFGIDTDLYKFSTQNLDVETGSKANASTGLTDILDLNETQNIENINVGIRKKDVYTIDEVLKVNNSARSMVRNVIYDQMLIGMKTEDVMDLIK